MHDLQFYNVDGTLRQKEKKKKQKPNHEMEDK